MRVTSWELNRATLERQLLLRREPRTVDSAIRQVMALQAQNAASPYIALWNRVEGLCAKELDAAFAGRTVVKATLMRITLHAVHIADYPVFHEAMQPTLRGRMDDARFLASGMTVAEADALITELLAFAVEPRTNAELDAWVDTRFEALPKPGPWWALRAFAPLLHAPTGGPWSFGARPSYMDSGLRPVRGREDQSMQALALRYLQSFGPASVADLAQFASVSRARARAAFEGMREGLEVLEGPGGATLYDIPGAPRPAGDLPAPPRLMAMWDSILLAYEDRGRVLPPEYRKLVIRSNGDVLPTVLVAGYVAGVWRPTDTGIEVTAFQPLPATVWAQLAAEAEKLLAFLADRDLRAYRRYDRWWNALSGEEVRVLPPPD